MRPFTAFEQRVRTIRLDALLPLMASDTVILKMDVEGKECDVIAGMAGLLAAGRTLDAAGGGPRRGPMRTPRFLRIEGTDAASRKCVERLARDHGYTVVWQALIVGGDLNLLLYRP